MPAMSLRDLPDSPPPTRTRRSGTVWALARQDYLAGGSAIEVCERHGLNLSTFRWRARKEGWRLKDQSDSPDDAPFSDALSARSAMQIEADGDDPLPDTLAPAVGLADTAWRHADRAIARGRLTEARQWLRVHDHLLRMANRARWQSVQLHEAAIFPVPPPPAFAGD